jgi:hypothetical protein
METLAALTPHPLTCQPTWRDRLLSEQPGSPSATRPDIRSRLEFDRDASWPKVAASNNARARAFLAQGGCHATFFNFPRRLSSASPSTAPEEVDLPEVRLNDLSSLSTPVGGEIVGNGVRYQVLHVRPPQGYWEVFRAELCITQKRVVL